MSHQRKPSFEKISIVGASCNARSAIQVASTFPQITAAAPYIIL